MFIDYVPLMLVNMAAGLCALAHFIMKGLTSDDHRPWAPAFAAAGAVALACGLKMIFTWPLPGSYNIAFGELSVLFGAVFAAAALSAALRWRLEAVTVYALVAGAFAIAAGIRIIALKMTQEPLLSGAGFVFTGLGGVCSYAALRWRQAALLRFAGAALMLAAAAIWIVTAFAALWMHLEKLAPWMPRVYQG